MRNAMNLDLDDLIDERATYSAETLTAMRKLARRRPWRLTPPECVEAFRECVRELCGAYNLQPIDVWASGRHEGSSEASCCRRPGREIRLTGRMSVVTLLYLFAVCRQWQTTGRADRFQAMRWSLSLFKRAFPRSFARCRFTGSALVNDNRS